MSQSYTITVQLGQVDVTEQTKGLLIPIAEQFGFQCCDNMRFDGIDGASKVLDQKGVQSAWFVPSELLNKPLYIEYDFNVEDKGDDQSNYKVGEVGEWTRALGYSLDNVEMCEQTKACKQSTVKAIVDHVAEKFDYVSRSSTGELANLTCDLVTGNCIDINNALMTLLSEAGIEHCYYAGIYAVDNSDVANRGWHCWVATKNDGQTHYWDIAQHLKSDLSDVQPGLNPVGGVRFALAQGTDLVFDIEDTRFELKKFPLPTVLFNDGSSELKLPQVTIKRL